MTARFTPDHGADIVAYDARSVVSGQYGRAFDLPPVLFAMTVGCYLAFLGVMAAAFMTGELFLPFVIFVTYIAMAFGVPALWAKMAPPAPGQKQDWAAFMRDGFTCATGHLSGAGAVTQVLMLPVLILAWGIAIAIIAAVV